MQQPPHISLSRRFRRVGDDGQYALTDVRSELDKRGKKAPFRFAAWAAQPVLDDVDGDEPADDGAQRNADWFERAGDQVTVRSQLIQCMQSELANDTSAAVARAKKPSTADAHASKRARTLERVDEQAATAQPRAELPARWTAAADELRDLARRGAPPAAFVAWLGEQSSPTTDRATSAPESETPPSQKRGLQTPGAAHAALGGLAAGTSIEGPEETDSPPAQASELLDAAIACLAPWAEEEEGAEGQGGIAALLATPPQQRAEAWHDAALGAGRYDGYEHTSLLDLGGDMGADGIEIDMGGPGACSPANDADRDVEMLACDRTGDDSCGAIDISGCACPASVVPPCGQADGLSQQAATAAGVEDAARLVAFTSPGADGRAGERSGAQPRRALLDLCALDEDVGPYEPTRGAGSGETSMGARTTLPAAHDARADLPLLPDGPGPSRDDDGPARACDGAGSEREDEQELLLSVLHPPTARLLAFPPRKPPPTRVRPVLVRDARQLVLERLVLPAARRDEQSAVESLDRGVADARVRVLTMHLPQLDGSAVKAGGAGGARRSGGGRPVEGGETTAPAMSTLFDTSVLLYGSDGGKPRNLALLGARAKYGIAPSGHGMLSWEGGAHVADGCAADDLLLDVCAGDALGDGAGGTCGGDPAPDAADGDEGRDAGPLGGASPPRGHDDMDACEPLHCDSGPAAEQPVDAMEVDDQDAFVENSAPTRACPVPRATKPPTLRELFADVARRIDAHAASAASQDRLDVTPGADAWGDGTQSMPRALQARAFLALCFTAAAVNSRALAGSGDGCDATAEPAADVRAVRGAARWLGESGARLSPSLEVVLDQSCGPCPQLLALRLVECGAVIC